jgi:hypothetical protein
MKPAIPLPFSYAALFDPAVALAAAKRAEHWNLPRHICHPLDHYTGRRASAVLSVFDAAVDSAPISEDDLEAEMQYAATTVGDSTDPDFEDDL